MNRSVPSLFRGLAATLVLTAVACGGEELSVSADHPWDVLPAEVVGVLHVNVKALTSAEMLRSLDQDFQGLAGAPLGMFADVEADTGINPLTDIDSLTMGGIMEAGEEGPYFLVIKGRFDLDRLIAFAESSPHAHSLDIDGVVAFDTINPGNPMADSPTVGFLDETTLLASSPADFPHFMKAVAGDIDSVADTPLARHAANSRHHVFAVFDIPDDAFAAPEAAMLLAMAPPLQELETVQIGINVSDGLDLSISAMAASEAASEAIEGVVQGFTGMSQMMAQQNPETAAALASLNVSRSGKTVQIAMQVSGDEVRAALEEVSPMVLAQMMPGSGGALPSLGSTPSLADSVGGPERMVNVAPAAASAAGEAPLPRKAKDSSGPRAAAGDGESGGGGKVVVGTTDDQTTRPVAADVRRSRGPTVDADSYESAIGSWVRITDTSGVEIKVKLTGVDEDTLTVEKRVSGGAMVMTMDRADVASMTLVLTS